MSSSADAVLAYWNEHRQQLRQCENQRATMTNFILVIVAALTGLIVQQKFTPPTAALGALIAILGLYGAVISAKYHERATYHLSQARALTTTLKDMGTLDEDANLNQSRTDHYNAFPLLHRLRLHTLWTGLHIAICAHGITLATITAF
ncbi:hypothetical protein [Catenuloplanes atrovinosus]|uniref:Uncharacterized protein n=1 Tax=Catenuloplanes atrovinosus TaxID=137266 RepID=A0AAE3YU42_9ACTN|nr:hypothetical protein [Catenuloplanes atrovinosus]MDR7277911.1 hypothetical protein [Catenuloplanes atrovinosus]